MNVENTKQRPYRGLVPFEEADAPYFFGRQSDVRLIIDNLFASRVTLLFGDSGVGKTSILRAGVIPTLRDIAAQNRKTFGQPELAAAICSQWQYDPLASAVSALEAAVGAGLPQADPPRPPLPQDLNAALEIVVSAVNGDVYFVLDQFEEYLVYHGDNPDEHFAAQLEQAVRNQRLRVHFLFSIREDRLARLDHFKGRIPGLFDNLLRVKHLGVEEAKQAIVGPIEKLNAEIEGGGFAVEPQLVEAIVAVGSGKSQPRRKWFLPGAKDVPTEVEAPFIQLVMEKVWAAEQAVGSRVLRLSTLSALGGPEQIAQRHVDAAMNALPIRQRSLALDVLRYLVTPSGGKFAMSVDDLAIFSERPVSRVTALLERLAKADLRILRSVDPPNGAAEGIKYEVSHDILAMALQEWSVRYRARRLQRRLRNIGGLAIFAATIAVSMLWWASLTQTEVTRKQEEVTQLQTQAEQKDKQLEKVVAESEETKTRLELATQSVVATRVDQIRDEGPFGPLVAGVAAMTALANTPDFAVELKLREILSSLLERTHSRLIGQSLQKTTLTPGASTALVLTSKSELAAFDCPSGKKLWQRTIPENTEVHFAPGEGIWVEKGPRGIRLFGSSLGIVGPLGPAFVPKEGLGGIEAYRVVGVGNIGFVVGNPQGELEIVDGYSGTVAAVIPKLSVPDPIVAVHSDGLQVAVGDGREVRVVYRDGMSRFSLPASAEAVVALGFVADGTRLAVGGKDGGARIYDFRIRNAAESLKSRLRSPFIVTRFVPGPGDWLAAVVQPRPATYGGAPSPQQLQQQNQPIPQRYGPAINSIKRVSSESVDAEGLVLFWNLQTTTEELRVAVATSIARTAFDLSGQTFAIVGQDRVVRLYTLPTGLELGRSYLVTADVDIGIFSEERTLPRPGTDQQRKEVFFGVVIVDPVVGRIETWSQTRLHVDLRTQLTQDQDGILQIAVDAAGNQIAVATGESGLHWLHGFTLVPKKEVSFSAPVTDVAMISDGSAVAVAAGNEIHYLRSDNPAAENADKYLKQQTFGGSARSLTLRHNTAQVAWVNRDHEGVLWDAAAGTTRRLGRDVTAVAYSTNGAYLAVARAGGRVDVLDTTTAGTVRTFRPGSATSVLRWAPDDSVCGAVGDFGLRLWTIDEDRGTAKNEPPRNPIQDLAFGGNRWNVLVHEGALARLIRDGIPVAHGEFSEPSRIVALSYHPKTGGFLVGKADGEIRTWLGRTDVLINQACQRLPGHWTEDQWKAALPEGVPLPDLSRCRIQRSATSD
ncbi:MAG: hypothetical protein HUU55_14265 [Myxococcales bacterium]|nr:hypothetical protein [Myxococcales bacterium]